MYKYKEIKNLVSFLITKSKNNFIYIKKEHGISTFF